ncbi:unnamed protein product [Rangifer tarandus platyrhynchus]|uniref:Uncharacterized protein n=2 Tax=Rangifer tarandus platyrhynchus TaxID=3082113 RepID=A0ABN8ZG86_RANTA|nr:unnamed protein product [Rangifer tarandus platyrhynchus]
MNTHRKELWGSKRRGHHPEEVMSRLPIGLWAGIPLGKKLHMNVVEGSRAGQAWKKKPDNGPEVKKDPEELPHMGDLPASLLCVSPVGRRSHPFSPGCCLCLSSV